MMASESNSNRAAGARRAADRGEKLGSLSELAALGRRLREQALAAQAEQRIARQRAEQSTREQRVFEEAMRGVAKLPAPERIAHTRPRPEPEPVQRQRDERAALAESLSDELDIDRLLDTDDQLSFRQPGIGADVVQRLRRGHWTIQAELDLHGLRSGDARQALVDFLGAAQRRGQRCVRVVHGKGLRSVNRQPVLKRKVLGWLIQRNEVMAFCQATPAAGGSGALVVLLR